jgi:hypothetical protein
MMSLAIVTMVSFPHDTSARPREDGALAESLGVGDTQRASTWGPAAIFQNPAGILRVPVIVVEGGYTYNEGLDGHAGTLAMLDARTNEFAAIGVAYTLISSAPDGRDRDGHQVRTALGTGYRTDTFALYAGLGTRWLSLVSGAEDGGENSESDDINKWTLDAGLILDFAQRIRFGVVGQNLIDTGTDEAARGLGLGFSFVFESLDVSANMDLDLTEDAVSRVQTWGFGADLGLMDVVHLRAGFTRDEQRDTESLHAGLGWSNSQVAVDLGYGQALSDPSAITLGLSVRWAP